MKKALIIFLSCIIILPELKSQTAINLVPVAEGWANNSVNTVIFRKNSLASHRDTQFIAYYDADQHVVVGKRQLGSKTWQLKKTNFTGKATDAHNSISIAVDGEGFLHMAWNHHNNSLHYVKSTAVGLLEFTGEMPMTGLNESKLSYPEFYNLPGGDLLFLYRDGQSGQGNLVVDRYDVKSKTWKQMNRNLVDGEGKRNAYWQACVDAKGVIHLSWVWRESPDVASNHDLSYAMSKDGGKNWCRSDGTQYELPITMKTAETVCRIPQGSELINQTSMTTDEKGQPIIAGYWKEEGTVVPQFHVVIKSKDSWKVLNTGFRKTGFSLSGGGTKRIPISRPQVISWIQNDRTAIALFFRDEERGNKVSVALNRDVENNGWEVKDLTKFFVGSWEPTFDIELWKQKKKFHLFVQNVEQIDGEGQAKVQPQMVQVLEWDSSKM